MIQSQIAVNRLLKRGLTFSMAAVTLLASIGLATAALAITAENAPNASYIYQVMRQGDIIGEQRLTFEHHGDDLIVTTDAKIDVKLLGLSLYGFDQHVEETWEKGQLVAVSSTADDSGTAKKVEMKVVGNQLVGNFNGKNRAAPLGIFPNSFWNEESVKQSQILDTSRGKVKQVTVTDRGKVTLTLPFGVVEAHHYSLDGEMKRELWYDDKGVLVAGELPARDGSTIRQELLRAP
ncbi:MAG TPA: DUF6134 family protein [Dongiaceae bacterium]|jgi:hypothetical protein